MHSLAIKLAVVSTLAFLLHGEGKAQVSIEPSASSVPRPSVLPAAPLKSPSPQEVAAQAFATDVARLSEEADAVDRLWHAYKAQCGARGGRRHDFGREWFALWDRSFEPTLATPACGELLSRLLQSGNSLRRELLEVTVLLAQNLRDALLRVDRQRKDVAQHVGLGEALGIAVLYALTAGWKEARDDLRM